MNESMLKISRRKDKKTQNRQFHMHIMLLKLINFMAFDILAVFIPHTFPERNLLLSSRSFIFHISSLQMRPLYIPFLHILPSSYFLSLFFKTLIHSFLFICLLDDSSYASPVFPKYCVFFISI